MIASACAGFGLDCRCLTPPKAMKFLRRQDRQDLDAAARLDRAPRGKAQATSASGLSSTTTRLDAHVGRAPLFRAIG